MRVERLMLNINAGSEIDYEKVADITLQLRENLLELDVEAVYLVGEGEAPVGAKAGEPVIWGTLLLTLSHEALKTVIGYIQSWLRGQGATGCRSVDLEIRGNKLKVKGISSKEQQRLIDTWITVVGKGDHA